jgi:hypothetical protein
MTDSEFLDSLEAKIGQGRWPVEDRQRIFQIAPAPAWAWKCDIASAHVEVQRRVISEIREDIARKVMQRLDT